ncbi:DUF4382 domain-containing protein [Bacteroidota bacterium]
MMMVRKIGFMVVALIAMLFVQSCNNESTSDNTARVQLKLIDAPGEYDAVIINIKDVQYNSSEDEEGWRSFETFTPGTVDLLTLTAGEFLSLSDEIIEAGSLKQIRLILSESGNEITVDGEISNLDTPSSQQSGLKLNLDTELVAGFTYAFILDFDVQESVVAAGNKGKYILKPVIRVSAEATSGSISGKVVELSTEVGIDNIRIDFVDEADVLNIGSATTNSSGDFLIQGLKEGSYTLNIDDTVVGTANLLYDASIPAKAGISIVGNGDVANVGTITLVKKTEP